MPDAEGLKRRQRAVERGDQRGAAGIVDQVAFEVERLDHRSLLDTPDEPLPSTRLTKPNLWFDCNSFGAKSIDMAVDLFGVDRIVYATDGTAFGCDWTNKALADTNLTEDERELIRFGNARAMIDHLAPFLNLSQAAE